MSDEMTDEIKIMQKEIVRTIVLLYAVGILANAQENKCPDLVAVSNMKLSETVGWVGDNPVTISCATGYVLDTATLQKNITCLAGGSVAIWNDTLGVCQKKACTDIDAVIGSTMAVDDGVSNEYLYGNNVTLECVEGYAFSVNNDVVTTQKIIYCDENVSSENGSWTDIGTCELISCETPPSLDNSVKVYNSTTFNSTTVYQCVSGHGFSDTRFHFTAYCNSTAQWSTPLRPNLENFRCSKLRKYLGCYQNRGMVVLSETEAINSGVMFCVDYCKSDNKRFAAVYNSTCSCGNELIESNSSQTVECNNICPGYDVTVPSQEAFCGGSSGEIAVYATLDGCYSSVNLANGPEIVTEDVELTCRERCRGKGFSHAVIQGDNECFCLNTTNISGLETDNNKCLNRTFYSTTQIYDLARKAPYLKTCQEMYTEGIRMNGQYYLEETDQIETCIFKDGTVCDDEWIGFDGYCYHFNNNISMNFDGARAYCVSLDADLVSITSSAEFDFLKETRDTFSDLWADESDPAWWLGFVDVHNTSLYMWVDGSLGTFSNFKYEPSDIDKYLAGDDKDKGYQWTEMDDVDHHNVMCKKPSGGPHCADIASITPGYSLVDGSMSLTYCIQLCKGQQLEFAIVQKFTCNCVDILPTFNIAPKNECLSECPGNRFQYCGGDANKFSVFNVSKKLASMSCEELQLFGFDNNTFLLQSTNETQIQQCGATACPFSWIFLNGSCYKYILYEKNIKEAIEMCAVKDAYMVTIETSTEIQEVINAANNIGLYSTVSSWRVGLLALSLNGGVFRWSNGKTFKSDYWNDEALGVEGPVVTVLSSNFTLWYAKSAVNDKTRFICEKRNDYKGCYDTTGMAWDIIITDYSSMTIQQCVEMCRVNARKYAFLNSTSCSCESSVTSENKGQCTSVCSGQDNQVCGGLDVMSVYDVDEFPSFANSCIDLFNAGIFISGRYLVSGTEQFCNFTDGTICSGDGWIGFNGNCYKFFLKRQTSHHETCRDNDAVQTSLTTVDEYNTIVEYIRRLNFEGGNVRVFTGITHGGYSLDVYMSDDGFLTDYSLIVNNHLVNTDLYDANGHVSFYIDHSHKHTTDWGVLCKENKYMIGCYIKPSNLVPILENYDSVELSLCRQLCIAYGKNITLIGLDFCACATEAELTTLTSTSGAGCNFHCSIPKNQLCGNGSTMWAYHSGIGDLPYGESCHHLYKSGIFYNSTYRIQSNESSVSFTEARCGFTDNTECPANWLGHNNMCYMFIKTKTTFENAVKHCADINAYVLIPSSSSSVEFVRSFINMSGLFVDNIWWSGIMPILYNISYISSNGRLVDVDHLISSNNLPQTHSVLNTDTLTLRANTHNKQQFICQKDKDFLGCYRTSDVPDAQYKNLSGNSLTQCIYWCSGQHFNYAAVFSHDCMCFHNEPALTSAPGMCNIVCEGGTSQMCGGVKSDNTVYYSVLNITNISGITGSCLDLFKLGIWKHGQYTKRIDEVEPFFDSYCYLNPAPLGNIFNNLKSLSASSTLDGHDVKDINLTFPITKAWKPSKDENTEYIKIILADEHLITGIEISGHHTHAEQSYVKSYTIYYRDLLTGVLEKYLYNGSAEIPSGCSEKNVLCFHYFLSPMVTNEIRLFPESWHNSISLQISLLGQLYSDFNHTATFIGCAADPVSTFSDHGYDMDIGACKNLCRDNLFPFASANNNGTCSCGHGNFDNGFVEESSCPLNTSVLLRTSNGINRAVYRTFYKHCDAPDFDAVLHGNISSISPIPDQPIIYGYKTKLVYSCQVGYEFPGGETDIESYCLQSNTWSKIDKNCSIVSCPSFNVANGVVNFTSLEYGGSATVMCNASYYAPNGMPQMTVFCGHNKKWSTVPNCAVDNLSFKQQQFTVTHGTIRNTSVTMQELRVRSKMDCLVRCTDLYYCKATNFKSDGVGNVGGTCRLFFDNPISGDLSADPDWNYMVVIP